MIVVHPSTAAAFPLAKLIQRYADMGYVLWFVQAKSGKKYLCLKPHSLPSSDSYELNLNATEIPISGILKPLGSSYRTYDPRGSSSTGGSSPTESPNSKKPE